MIEIKDKQDCCGCGACAQKCPKQCIRLTKDSEGFLYPIINKEECIECRQCIKVCPVINQTEKKPPLATFAAKNKNENARLASSSGGVFSCIAEKTLKNGGVVFGAAFNTSWEVEHIYIDNLTDLEKLRGSKYVQSTIGNSYLQAEKFLKSGKEVLFSGTPCQIAGLKKFLLKEYSNLTTIDVVCHGTPSPLIWEKYLKEIIEEHRITNIKSISFRDKTEGWKKFSFAIKWEKNGTSNYFRETLDRNLFMGCFLQNLCLRPSCYSCPARSGKSGSDITIADLWGAENICPVMDDDKGTSLVIIRNSNYNLPELETREIEYSKSLKYNLSIEQDVKKPKKRNKLFSLAAKKSMHEATRICTTEGKFEILLNKIIWNIKNRILR